jgi:hypothetical protein
MRNDDLETIFDIEARCLDRALRTHPRLEPFFTRAFDGDTARLRDAYLGLLQVTADYVALTVPMLRAAGMALRAGDAEDRAWGDVFLAYAQEETDERERYGHHVWALNDMRALGVAGAALAAEPHPSVAAYARFLVDNAARHPFAVLGTKGVLEHLSLRAADDLVAGVVASGIAHAADAVTFFASHGALDVEHVNSGNRNLVALRDQKKRDQVVEGAYFTSGSYRAFLMLALT